MTFRKQPKQIKQSNLLFHSKRGRRPMPTEIFDTEKFVEVSERADYCAIKRLEKIVKLKLRTSRQLYTLKVKPSQAEEIIKKLRCEIREI